MKILCIGDMHLKETAGNREGYVFDKIKLKIEEAFAIARREDCKMVLQTGDFFDTPRPSFRLLTDVVDLFDNAINDLAFYCILGQHDKYMRTGLERSPMSVVNRATKVGVLCPETTDVTGYRMFGDKGQERYNVYGACFGDDIPVPTTTNNILIIHRMITPTDPSGGFMTCEDPRLVLRDNPEYELILCGDYHGSFEIEYQGRWIVNPGALTRQTRADINTWPGVGIYDTKAKTYKRIDLTCVEPDPFIAADKALAKAGTNDPSAQLDALVAMLKTGAMGLSFEDILVKHLNDANVSADVRKIIYDALESANVNRV